jgi:hypothetical protein
MDDEKLVKDKLEAVIKKYNKTAALQAERLRLIFYTLKDREGYRRLQFANDVWTNCFGNLHVTGEEKIINGQSSPITEYELGIPK